MGLFGVISTWFGSRRRATVAPPSSPLPARLSVVLCGSFRRDLPGLRASFDQLAATCDVVSPVSLDFVDPTAEFVRLDHERDEPEAAVEARHLAAIARADFVWLHAPGGYVGTSAAMELGYAAALGVAVFCDTAPSDPVLASLVTVVDSPAAIGRSHDRADGDPGAGLVRLQRYYETVARRRGWAGESPAEIVTMLVEELGELSRAVRADGGVDRRPGAATSNLAEELADMQLLLVHLATATTVDMAAAVSAKETRNSERSARRSDAA